MRSTKHVVMLSGGMSSAYLAKVVLDTYGSKDTILFFTDTKWEDEDNYRFLKDLEAFFDKEIVWYEDGRTPEDVFWQKRFLGNFGFAPCSRELKMKQTVIFVESLRLTGNEPILYFGIGKRELRRAPRIAEMYSHHCVEPLETRFPLISMDVDNESLRETIEGEWGISVPRMYNWGFKHANCGGRCVKAGMKHYKLLRDVWPDRFKAQVDMEKRFRHEINDYTLLKRNGQPFPLETLERTLADQLPLLDDQDQLPCTCIFETKLEYTA